MKKNNLYCPDFNTFINFKSDDKIFPYRYIFLSDIEYCSFVRYLFVPVINGEIFGYPFSLSFDNYDDFYSLYYSGEFVVYAINYLDNFVLEVVSN